MDKNSFLEALRNIFKKARVADVESIIEVYEEHFAVGYEKGLTDSEIIKSLGTPEEIYASYVDAGIITDTLGQDGGNSKAVNMQEIYARFDDYKERLLPQLPGMAKKASKTLLSIGSALSYIVGVLIFIITPAILYLLGSSWQPFENGSNYNSSHRSSLIYIAEITFAYTAKFNTNKDTCKAPKETYTTKCN